MFKTYTRDIADIPSSDDNASKQVEKIQKIRVSIQEFRSGPVEEEEELTLSKNEQKVAAGKLGGVKSAEARAAKRAREAADTLSSAESLPRSQASKKHQTSHPQAGLRMQQPYSILSTSHPQFTSINAATPQNKV
ncbi:MAG: hypothetical protein Q9183_006886 [Haloplaca sp. 2 TL-2023]